MSRTFIERLHQQLDNIGMPRENTVRTNAFARLFSVSKTMSRSILSGCLKPDGDFLNKIADELEIEPGWLLGQDQFDLKKDD